MNLKQTPVILTIVISGLIINCSAKTPACCQKASVKTCSAPAAAAPDTSAQPAKKDAPEQTILFFMNPNGRPCQMQNEIIEGIKGKLTGLAKVTYVKTTEDADREQFSKYGIRGLPSLIILDKEGKEVKRFPPGIQDEETILASLKRPADK
jgi:thioredoxin 1